MRRTRQLLAQNVEHTAANLSVIGGAALAEGEVGRWTHGAAAGGHVRAMHVDRIRCCLLFLLWCEALGDMET
jgi:hypothetical protein